MARDKSIDIAKGIGIILVVIGHVTSPVMLDNDILQQIYRGLYTFHMPLFFLLAGVSYGLASHKVKIGGGIQHFIKRRFLRLMVPYFTWALIYTPVKMIMKEYVRFKTNANPLTLLLGNNPDGELWFLYVLFLLNVIAVILINNKNALYWMSGGLAISAVSSFIPTSVAYPGISLSFSLYQVGFFFAGVWLGLEKSRFESLKQSFVICISGIAFVMFQIALFRHQEIESFRIIAGIAGVLVVIGISTLIERIAVGEKLCWLGVRSMQIFILHAPMLIVIRKFLPKIIPNQYLYIPIASLIVIVGSLTFSELILNRTKLLKRLLVGT